MRITSASVRFVGACVVTLLATAALTTASQAQQPALPLARGTRIRVTSPVLGNGPGAGTMLAQTRDSLTFRPDGAPDSVSLSFANIRQLEVSNGSHTRALKGLGMGFLVGAGSGAILGAAAYKPCRDSFACIGAPTNRGMAAGIGGIVGGILGTVIGGVVGVLSRREGWAPVLFVASPSSRLRIEPEWGDGLELAVTI